MRKPLLFAATCLILAGCAASTRVSLLPGEKDDQGQQSETGAVVVLNQGSEQDIRLIDQANSRSGVKGNRVALKKVTMGRDFGSFVEVLDGVTAADRVIVNPPDALVDGAEVRALTQPADAK